MSDWQDEFQSRLIAALLNREDGKNRQALAELDEASRIFREATGLKPQRSKRGRRPIQEGDDPDRWALWQMDYWAKTTGEQRAESLARRIADMNPRWRPDLAAHFAKHPTFRQRWEALWAFMHTKAASRDALVKRLAKKWKIQAKI